MSKQTLTDAGVRALKPPASGQVTVWDVNSPLGVRVSRAGAKTYIVMLGSGKRHSIGPTSLVGLSEARSEAKRLKAEKVLGLTKPRVKSFATALSEFLEDNYKSARPRTKAEAKRLLEKHFLPSFKNIGVADLTDRDIARELAKVTAPSEKLHAFRVMRTFLNWCVRPPHRYIKYSPMQGYQPPSTDNKRSRILSDDELVKVWAVAPPPVKLLILWGTRRGETGQLRGEWFKSDMLVIPGSHTKNRRSHSVPLLPLAREVLGTVPSKGPLYGLDDNGWRTVQRRLWAQAGFNDWSVHDLRRSFRSLCSRLQVSRDLAEILLNHVGKSPLDEIYDQYDYLAEKKSALAKIEAHISQLLQVR